MDKARISAALELLSEAFPKHRGRKGKRGGSMPKSAGLGARLGALLGRGPLAGGKSKRGDFEAKHPRKPTRGKRATSPASKPTSKAPVKSAAAPKGERDKWGNLTTKLTPADVPSEKDMEGMAKKLGVHMPGHEGRGVYDDHSDYPAKAYYLGRGTTVKKVKEGLLSMGFKRAPQPKSGPKGSQGDFKRADRLNASIGLQVEGTTQIYFYYNQYDPDLKMM